MKSSAKIFALSALTLAASAAMAADVTLYGVVDTGLKYQHVDADMEGVDAVDSFTMDSGIVKGSRFGFKGTEELGNGLTVGFVLENGFNGDDGTLADSSRLFNRESQLFVRGAFGEVSFGRVGSLTSGNGTYGLAGNLSPFGTTWGDYAANASNVMSGFDRYDNTITYKSPNFAGVNVYAQYSFDTNTKDDYNGKGLHGTEGKSSVDRYYAIGITYANGPLNLVGIVDSTNFSTLKWSSATTGNPTNWGSDVEDAYTVTLGGSYDFNVVKFYLGAQYFDNADLNSIDNVNISDYTANPPHFQVKGYGIVTGVDVPLFGGTGKFAVGYVDGTIEKANGFDMADLTHLWGEVDISRWHVSAGYQYNLSKRTSVYGVASYSASSMDPNLKGPSNLDIDPSAVECAVGLVHTF